jgi:type II secretory pathway pseudopilin PulG
MALEKSNSSSGFSLIEVVISMGLLTLVSLGVAQLFAISTNANRVARSSTSTIALAEQKMEQLRSLSWGFDLQGLGLPVSDTTTNLAVYPHRADGRGLNPSPSDSLEENRDGYHDFLDRSGNWLGTGSPMPTDTAYVRRWAIRPLPTNPNNTLVFQVLVTTVANESSYVRNGTETRKRMAGDALLTSVRTRKAS